jgi:hypothetical protein
MWLYFRRVSLTLAVLCSLLLCVGFAGLWAWTRARALSVQYKTERRLIDFNVYQGRVAVNQSWPAPQGWVHRESPKAGWRAYTYYHGGTGRPLDVYPRIYRWGGKWGSFGFTAGGQPGLGPNFLLPCWFLCGLFSLAPALWLLRTLRIRRARKLVATGRCPECGYDLRAGHERCPESGFAPSSLPEGIL